MPQPEVLSGMRQPRVVRLEEQRAKEAASPESAQVVDPLAGLLGDDEVTVYISPTRGYRVQVTAPRTIHDPATGRSIPAGKRYEAQFVEGVFRNGAHGTPGYKNPAVRKLFDDALQSNPYFGQPGGGTKIHFWLASEQVRLQKEASVRAALATLRSLPPEQVKAFAAQLEQGTAEDHTPPPPARTAKPIPAAAE